VRKNLNGELYSLNWGKSSGFAIDPIEKKPFFHFKPASNSLSFGTPGCNFRCLNCQNWDLSQGVRQVGQSALDIKCTSAKEIANMAKQYNVDSIAYTYSEPTIFFEYAYDTVRACKSLDINIPHLFVSNGYFSKEAFEFIQNQNMLQAIRIDLKFMDDKKYQKICGAKLKPVLNSIERTYKSKIHLEVINLLIPEQNDSEYEIEKLCKFIYSLSEDIPLHFSKFFPHYKMQDVRPTSTKSLQNAKKIAKDVGLNYVYLGNVDIKGAQDTICPNCNSTLISRNRFEIEKNVFEKSKNPTCPECNEKIHIVL